MTVSNLLLTPLTSVGLCDAKLEGYECGSAPLFLCAHPSNCPCGLFAIHNNNVDSYLSLRKHFPSLAVFFWGSMRTAMNSTYLPLLTYLKRSNNLFFQTPLCCTVFAGAIIYT